MPVTALASGGLAIETTVVGPATVVDPVAIVLPPCLRLTRTCLPSHVEAIPVRLTLVIL